MDQPATGGRLPLFPLFIVVVLAGLALGALLSRHFSGASPMPQVVVRKPAPSPLVTVAPFQRVLKKTPIIRPTRTPLLTSSPSAEPSMSASPRSPRAVIHRVALTTPKPPLDRKIAAAPAGSPRPVLHATPVARAVLPQSSPTRSAPQLPQSGSDAAAAIARDYLTAVIRGDNRSANSALGKSPSSLPSFAEQSFLDPQARITNLHATNNGDGTYKVEAEVAASRGTYYVTLQVMRNASTYYITDHYAIKVQ